MSHVGLRGCFTDCALLLQVGGYWSSGLPFLDISYKLTKRPWEAGLQLPLMMLNITDLQVRWHGTHCDAGDLAAHADATAGICRSTMCNNISASAATRKRIMPLNIPPLTLLPVHEMLQAAVAALPEEAWTYEYQAKHSAVMAGRDGNQKAFKPGEHTVSASVSQRASVTVDLCAVTAIVALL